MSLDWRFFLKIAYEEAKRSNDPSTQNAALLINEKEERKLIDINRFPKGVKEIAERYERPLKYKYIEHAERNVLYKAARLGVKTDRLIMVCPWTPCTDCARAIIQSGVRLLVTHKQAFDRSPQSWLEDLKIALLMLEEAGVEIIWYDGVVGVMGVRHSGQLWDP